MLRPNPANKTRSHSIFHKRYEQLYQILNRSFIVYLSAIQSSKQKVKVSGSGLSVRNWSSSAELQPRDSIKSSIQLVIVASSMYFAPRHTGQISPLRVPVPPHSGQSQWVVTGSGAVRMLFMLGKSTRVRSDPAGNRTTRSL
jgi:hypothetical protein